MIKVSNLYKSYGSLQVLKGLNLVVEKGETLVILGRSGAGKSVLLKQIMGLEYPDSGTIEVEGKDITKMSQSERFRKVRNMGMLFQGSALFDSMTIGENTAFFLTEHPDIETKTWLTPQELTQRVDESLKMVGLEGTRDKLPSNLSGGMRRRAALARLIAYRPTILLYDEPTTELDPITAMQINDLIVATQRKLKATSIVVTHDIHTALSVGDRLALHYDGRIVQIAPKDQFFQIDDPLLQAFLENATFHETIVKRKNHA
jgi:phospholipid/cholesterol/gamma-HCH transport system ATP-binding protein